MNNIRVSLEYIEKILLKEFSAGAVAAYTNTLLDETYQLKLT